MSRTLLIVDDSAAIREVVKQVLISAGYHCVEAIDGQDALQQLDNHKIDLIVSDLNMPRLDGLSFAREARSRAKSRFTPILMLTTETSLERKAQGQAAGVSGWLAKPFESAQLLKAIKLMLKT